ncbi:tetratricopeptide repeat protein [Thalassotalea sp. PLHSN55]|uniref:tetratricopeptide repeat protein n=1 Tax=Thalassotalea sp. PLHSN55 TaxID=3435888 RepID=UPI003F85A7E2
MNIKNALNRAAVFYKDGSFTESLSLCDKVLAKKSTVQEAMYLLALNYQGMGRYDQAITAFEKLLKVHGNNADVFNAISNTYICLKDFSSAEKYCQMALKFEPNFAEAHNNYAICAHNTQQIELAEKHYKQAILLKGDELVFRLNLGKLYKELGRFEHSNETLLKLMEFNGDKSAVYFNIYDNFMYMHQYQNALEVADMGLVSQQLKDIDLIELLVGKAILFWLFDNVDEAEQAIQLSEGVYTYPEGNYENLTNLKVFHGYLKRLIAFYRENESLYTERQQDLYFISESHGFAPNNMRVTFEQQNFNIRSLFVKGAKVFHFSQQQNNRFKESLNRVMTGLPENSAVVFAFGEIDCRYNEGILKYCLAHDADYKNIIDKMLASYIDALITQGQKKKFKVIIYGVPAPHADQLKFLSEEHQVILKNIIQYFNETIRALCKKNGLAFLDVYQLTNLAGQSNNKYHIDDIHVHPSVVPKLFEKLN